jgi:hypothetical protein
MDIGEAQYLDTSVELPLPEAPRSTTSPSKPAAAPAVAASPFSEPRSPAAAGGAGAGIGLNGASGGAQHLRRVRSRVEGPGAEPRTAVQEGGGGVSGGSGRQETEQHHQQQDLAGAPKTMTTHSRNR